MRKVDFYRRNAVLADASNLFFAAGVGHRNFYKQLSSAEGDIEIGDYLLRVTEFESRRLELYFFSTWKDLFNAPVVRDPPWDEQEQAFLDDLLG